MSSQLPLVLIPGILCSAAIWKKQVDLFERIIPVHVINVLQKKTITEIADDIVKLCNEKINVVGFSSGGYVAQDIVKRYPGKVNSLILINTSGEVFAVSQQKNRREFIKAIKEHGEAVAARQFFNKLLSTYDESDHLRREMSEMVASVQEGMFRHQMEEVIRQVEVLPGLESISCPTLIIASEDDPFMSRESYEEMTGKIKNSKLRLLKNGGHMLPLTKYEDLNSEILDFCDYENISLQSLKNRINV